MRKMLFSSDKLFRAMGLASVDRSNKATHQKQVLLKRKKKWILDCIATLVGVKQWILHSQCPAEHGTFLSQVPGNKTESAYSRLAGDISMVFAPFLDNLTLCEPSINQFQ